MTLPDRVRPKREIAREAQVPAARDVPPLPERLWKEPWHFDFFSLLRRIERSSPGKPRIGDSQTPQEDVVLLGQDPYMDFPASMLGRAVRDARGRTRLSVKFLGMLGPQGALPYATTEEAYGWLLAGNDSFPRFLSVLENRFLQLFFRSWADVRPQAQFDRSDDRFADYVGSAIGIGSAPYRRRDGVPDRAKLGFAGLIGAQVRSAARLQAYLAGLFGIAVEVEQFVGSWLAFDPADRSRLGQANARLGQDLLLGSAVFTIEDKILIRLQAGDMDQFRDFLPKGRLHDAFNDAVFFMLGNDVAWDLEISVPARKIVPMRLSRSGQLGWTSWVAPPGDAPEDAVRSDARFQASERYHAARRSDTITGGIR